MKCEKVVEGVQEQAENAMTQANRYRAEAAELKKENKELRAKIQVSAKADLRRLRETVSLLMYQFMKSVWTANEADGLSDEQTVIAHRLEHLIVEQYPGEDCATLMAAGQSYLEALIATNGNPQKSASQEFEELDSEPCSLALKNPDETVSGFLEKDDKHVERETGVSSPDTEISPKDWPSNDTKEGPERKATRSDTHQPTLKADSIWQGLSAQQLKMVLGNAGYRLCEDRSEEETAAGWTAINSSRSRKRSAHDMGERAEGAEIGEVKRSRSLSPAPGLESTKASIQS